MSFKTNLLDILSKFKDSPTIKEVIQSLEGDVAPTKVECAKSGVIADGSTIETPTDFVIDAEVYTTDADGNQIPVIDGEYIIDGMTSIVVAGGKITEVSAVAEEAVDTEMSAEVSAIIEGLVTRIASLEEANAAINTNLSAITAERDTLNSEKNTLNVRITELSKQAAVASVKKVSQSQPKADAPAKPFHKMTMEERVLANFKK